MVLGVIKTAEAGFPRVILAKSLVVISAWRTSRQRPFDDPGLRERVSAASFYPTTIQIIFEDDICNKFYKLQLALNPLSVFLHRLRRSAQRSLATIFKNEKIIDECGAPRTLAVLT